MSLNDIHTFISADRPCAIHTCIRANAAQPILTYVSANTLVNGKQLLAVHKTECCKCKYRLPLHYYMCTVNIIIEVY